MAQLTLELPNTLHHQLTGLAQREGIQLPQYILYTLTQQLKSTYMVQIMPAEDIAEQRTSYEARREQRMKASPAQITDVLAEREEVEPEPELTPELIQKVRQRIQEKQNEM